MTKHHLLRTVRNLGLAALLGVLIWAAAGYPLPMELAFRRCERQSLTAASEIVWTYRGARSGDQDMLVGLSDTAVHIWHPNGYIHLWSRQDGGTLVPLPAETRYQDRANSYLAPALLVPDPPAGAESARLTITLHNDDWTEDYVMEGQRQGDVFFFQLEMRHQDDSHRLDERNAFTWVYFSVANYLLYPSAVEFFDEDGALLSAIQQEGRYTVEVMA